MAKNESETGILGKKNKKMSALMTD